MNKIAMFDMDDTLADYTGQLLKDLDHIKSVFEPPITLELLNEHHDYIEQRRHTITKMNGWFQNLPMLELGFDILELCNSIGYELAILTKGPKSKPHVASEKLFWCLKNLSDFNIEGVTISHDKSLVYADVLVDDWPGYVDEWLKNRPRGLVIMPVHKHNEGYKHHNVIRYDGTNIREVEIALMAQFNRKRGDKR